MIYFCRFLIFSSAFSLMTLSHADSYKEGLLKAADKEARGEYVRKKFVALLGKKFTTKNKKKLLVIGDSHAEDFINMINENNILRNYEIKTRHIPTQCQVVLSDNYDDNIKTKHKKFCAESDSVKKALPQIKNADSVILVANWTLWSAKLLPETIKNLNLSDEQQLFIIGRKSFGQVKLRKLIRKSKKSLLALSNRVDANQEKINKLMQETLDDTIYINFHKAVCEQAESCRLFTKDLKLISFDGGHLTQAGAAYLGEILFEKTNLSSLTK